MQLQTRSTVFSVPAATNLKWLGINVNAAVCSLPTVARSGIGMDYTSFYTTYSCPRGFFELDVVHEE